MQSNYITSHFASQAFLREFFFATGISVFYKILPLACAKGRILLPAALPRAAVEAILSIPGYIR